MDTKDLYTEEAGTSPERGFSCEGRVGKGDSEDLGLGVSRSESPALYATVLTSDGGGGGSLNYIGAGPVFGKGFVRKKTLAPKVRQSLGRKTASLLGR